jgi:hypothetical protein
LRDSIVNKTSVPETRKHTAEEDGEIIAGYQPIYIFEKI